jgi:hypothetical protein
MKSIDKAVELSPQTPRNAFKRNLTRFAAVLLAALPALSPFRTELWLPHTSIMIKCRASTE